MGDYYYYNPYEYNYSAEELYTTMQSNLAGVLMLVSFVAILGSVTFSVIGYILRGAGLYTIAERRRLHHSWLAWVPIGNLWMLGSVSDQYWYVVKGKIKNRRIQLVLLGGILTVLRIVWLMCFVEVLGTGKMTAGFGLCTAAIVILPTIHSVLQYMAYYDLYRSCEPENGVLYLILSIAFPVATPFFVFFSRKKDGGMPPRKQTEIPQEVKEENFAQSADFEEK